MSSEAPKPATMPKYMKFVFGGSSGFAFQFYFFPSILNFKEITNNYIFIILLKRNIFVQS